MQSLCNLTYVIIPSSQKIRTRQKYLLGTLNINMLSQAGKLKQLTNVLKEGTSVYWHYKRQDTLMKIQWNQKV